MCAHKVKTHAELTIFDKNGAEVASIDQPDACLRYIGSICGLYPKGNVERLLVDEILDACQAFYDKAEKFGDNPMDSVTMGDTSEVQLSSFVGAVFGLHIADFSQKLIRNEKRGYKTGWFVGDNMTIADLKVGWLLKRIIEKQCFPIVEKGSIQNLQK